MVLLRTLITRTCCAAAVGWALTACSASVQEGVAAFKRADYAKALTILSHHESDPAAQYYLFELYDNGLGVHADSDLAKAYLERAAAGKNADAEVEIGKRYLAGTPPFKQDKIQALQYLQSALELHHSDAPHALGDYYADEKGGNDLGQARRYYEMDKGTNLGAGRLAFFHEYGYNGLPYSPATAFSYLKGIVERSDADWTDYVVRTEAFNLAEYYYYGFGTERSAEKALALLTKIRAADPKDENASAMFAWMQFHGEGTHPDPRSAVETWEQQAKQLLATPATRNPSGYIKRGLQVAYDSGMGAPFDDSIKVAMLTGKFPKSYSGVGGMDGQITEFKRCLPMQSLQAPGRYLPLAAEAWLVYSDCQLHGALPNRAQAYQAAMNAAAYDPIKGALKAQEILKTSTPAQRREIEQSIAWSRHIEIVGNALVEANSQVRRAESEAKSRVR